ncbi:hypothetical protein Pla111_27760 [Botrimarina hoheduenensis]|uniref:Uncharacterized protein n=1 Tax=Botrimarina hoheduenensis TaxID=2528000 RepID=A0A5C5VXN1_9BACT|nr:hypothetical protein Pla111_27760 [Botrimarina hoheduenensis]
MLTREQIDAVLELLALPERPSNRQIAILTGVSRSSVNSLANGRRSPYAREDVLEPPVSSATGSGPPTRCLTCGQERRGRCVRCAAQRHARQIIRPKNTPSGDADRWRCTDPRNAIGRH